MKQTGTFTSVLSECRNQGGSPVGCKVGKGPWQKGQ